MICPSCSRDNRDGTRSDEGGPNSLTRLCTRHRQTSVTNLVRMMRYVVLGL